MIVFYLFLKMVFLVIRKYELRYNSYDCEDTTSILGIYTSKIKAEERLKQEGVVNLNFNLNLNYSMKINK
jgi:hypothetical protein